ncbi:inositol monophosphatase [Mycolicibacterium sp. S2-37]|uniref:inositol monophosphatase family protein n=1 Tax=Mycolicibacterium sp. S2-37 TaxID=2810297 RepID=UPI001A93F1A3|nr:inositol monophosphatase family protein [Mycolicibacterium sp. S2-37]MBO0676977.1 inositol monophosphatase [Mycolicibacterium sp. S2-37]
MSDGAGDGDDPRALREVAQQLATEAAAFVRRRRDEVFGAAAAGTGSDAVAAKSTPTDPVTVVDTETERLLRERLAELRPGDQILGEEEGGTADAAAGQLTWVLDPIDGTVNFVYDIWAYAVSVAVQRDGESVAGAVADVANHVVYSAARGAGASMTSGTVATPLRCSGVGELSLALLGTGFAYAPQRRREQAEILVGVLPHVRDVRRIGSCALDLCMVAAGRLDAYYEDGVNVWDWAAGALIAAEAGARVQLPTPAGAVGGDGLVIAAAPGVADGLADVLARVGVS